MNTLENLLWVKNDIKEALTCAVMNEDNTAIKKYADQLKDVNKKIYDLKFN